MRSRIRMVTRNEKGEEKIMAIGAEYISCDAYVPELSEQEDSAGDIGNHAHEVNEKRN